MPTVTMPTKYHQDIATLWVYNQMHHELNPVDLAVGLGSHDIGVASHTAELYKRGLFSKIIFTGANAPTTVDIFPQGEAIHYRDRALQLGVPEDAILVETKATNTGENIDFSRALVQKKGLSVRSIMLVSRPYQQRRAYAMARLRWPEVDVICASEDLSLAEYIARIGDADRVINMLVGDTQRVWTYAEKGWAVRQPVPNHVRAAYERLVSAGFTKRVASVGL